MAEEIKKEVKGVARALDVFRKLDTEKVSDFALSHALTTLVKNIKDADVKIPPPYAVNKEAIDKRLRVAAKDYQLSGITQNPDGNYELVKFGDKAEYEVAKRSKLVI